MPVSREVVGLGVVYTPPEVARPMVELVLRPLAEGKSAAEILALRVCDPAIGEGAFLREVVCVLGDYLAAAWAREAIAQHDHDTRTQPTRTSERRLAASRGDVHRSDAAWSAQRSSDAPIGDGPIDTRVLTLEARRLVARTCIAGVEIDPRALTAACNAIAALVEEPGLAMEIAQLRISDALASTRDRGAPPQVRAVGDGPAEIAGADTIPPDASAAAGASDGSSAFAQRATAAHGARTELAVGMAHDANASRPRLLVVGDALTLDWSAAFPTVVGFHAVVANPPYIRQEQLATKAHLETFATYDGGADLYVYFIELAHRILRPQGRYCMIVPNKWQTAAYGRSLREFLVDAGSVEGLVDLSTQQVFANADAFPCILFGTRDRVVTATVRALRATSGTSVAAALATEAAIYDQPREQWTAEPWHIESPEERALLVRLEGDYPALGDVLGTRWSRGVVTGFNEAFVLDRMTRDRLLAEEPGASDVIRPFVKGRDLAPYLAPEAERWILLIDRGTSLDALPRVRAHLDAYRAKLEPRPGDWTGEKWAGRKPGAYAWFELQDPVVPLAKSRAPRILYQDIQTTPLACLDRSGDLVPDTTVWILPSTDLVLLAILNSPLYGWFARHRFPPALGGAVRPKLAYMQRLPVPPAPPALRATIEALVTRRLSGALVDAEIAACVAQLYELSPEERNVVEGS